MVTAVIVNIIIPVEHIVAEDWRRMISWRSLNNLITDAKFATKQLTLSVLYIVILFFPSSIELRFLLVQVGSIIDLRRSYQAYNVMPSLSKALRRYGV